MATTIQSWLRRDWLRALLLAVAAAAVHLPALQGERIWDDHYLSQESPFIKSPLLILETFRHYLFPDSFSAHYRPTQNISYIVDYFLWNTDTWGFHLTNVLLHAASGVVLYFLLRYLLASLVVKWRNPPSCAPRTTRIGNLRHLLSGAAFLVALTWVVHPVQSAAVDYISGRADSLAFFFAAGGWLLFLRAGKITRQFGRIALYLCAAGSGLLALCSREIALVWIALFVGYLLFVENKLPGRMRAWSITGCIAIIAIYIGLRQLPEPRAGGSADNWSAPVRVALMMRALGDYGRLLVFPSTLHMERTVFDPFIYRSPDNWRSRTGIEYLSLLGLLVLGGLVFGSIWRGRGRAMRIFGASWFLVAYLPVSNVVRLNATVAEHWLYLPSVGFFIFLAGCAVALSLCQRKFVTVLALFAAVALGVRSYLRSTDWVTAETFYRRTLAAGGTSARTGLNLAQIYAGRRDYKEAERICRKVLEIAPDYPLAQNNLASAISHQGRQEEAERLFAQVEENSKEARKEYPRTWIGAVNHARLRFNAHDKEGAVRIAERARKEYPEVWEIVSFESEVLRQIRGPETALEVVEEFARQNWWHHGAALALGRLYAQRGDVDFAEAALRRASLLDVHDTEALRLMTVMRLRQNKLPEALQTQRRAVARQPDEPRQYILLSDVLEKMGRTAEARAALDKAAQLRSFAENEARVN